MAKFQVEGAIFDTERAAATWEEATDWNGSNHISRATSPIARRVVVLAWVREVEDGDMVETDEISGQIFRTWKARAGR